MENKITLAVSILSFIVSIATAITTFINGRNNIKTKTITENRVIWIKDVRNLVMDFLEVYINQASNKEEKRINLITLSSKINLYFRKNVKSYDDLTNILNKCIEEEYSDENLQLLIEKSQIVFGDVWKRAKYESGITDKENELYERIFGNK